MREPLEMNCVGMKCPRPIIEIAKAARKLPPGTILSVLADDLAFESDVTAWVEHVNAALLSVDRDGRSVSVRIRLAE